MPNDAIALGAAHSRSIIFGREGHAENRAVGFGSHHSTAEDTGSVIGDESEGHLLVVAPTGAGKGRNIIIPNLGNYGGPAIVIDPKGEAAMVTARRRRELGQLTVIIDPFGVCGEPTDGLNPLDLLAPESENFEADCFMIAKMLTGGQLSAVDRFWDQNAECLIAGIVAYLAEHGKEEDRNLSGLRRYLCDPDLTDKMATALDGGLGESGGLACEEFKNFIAHEGEKVRTSVRSTAMQHMMIFAGRQVERAVERSTFCVNHVTSGEGITIYLVIPPHKLEAYGTLLRIWVATLLTLITRREKAPPVPTLFILDELAQLGQFPLLRPAVTLLRGYGVRCMLFLQDVAQLRALFPADHSTIVNNCASVVSFGHTSFPMSREMSEIFGDLSADQLFGMGRGALAVRRAGKATRIVDRLDYLNDSEFSGMFDANRMAQATRRSFG